MNKCSGTVKLPEPWRVGNGWKWSKNSAVGRRMESPHDPSSWLNKHFKVEEDLEQTIIEKKWFGLLQNDYSNFKSWDDRNDISTFPQKKRSPFPTSTWPFGGNPLFAAEVAHINVQWLHQITPTVEAAVTGSWSHLQFTWHHGRCGLHTSPVGVRELGKGPGPFWMHHAVHWDCYRMTLNIKMTKTSHGSIGSSQQPAADAWTIPKSIADNP